jgi:hypothetical protein
MYQRGYEVLPPSANMRKLVPPAFSTLEDLGGLRFVIVRKNRQAKMEYLKQ